MELEDQPTSLRYRPLMRVDLLKFKSKFYLEERIHCSFEAILLEDSVISPTRTYVCVCGVGRRFGWVNDA